MEPRFDFSEALKRLKAGKRVCRSGWNGKGMWLALTPSTTISNDQARRGAALMVANIDNPSTIEIGGHIDMRAADGSLVIGWLASQTDMLANDWMEVI